MFKLFKRKNEIKELKCRVAVLEAQVTALNSKKKKKELTLVKAGEMDLI